MHREFECQFVEKHAFCHKSSFTDSIMNVSHKHAMYMVYDLCVHVKFGDSGFQTYNSNMLSKYSILELWGT